MTWLVSLVNWIIASLVVQLLPKQHLAPQKVTIYAGERRFRR